MAENKAPERIWIHPIRTSNGYFVSGATDDAGAVEYRRADLAAPDAVELLRSLIPELCEYCAGPVNGFTFPLKQWGVPENNNVSFSHTGTLNHTPCGADQIHTFLLLNKTPTGDAVRQARREMARETMKAIESVGVDVGSSYEVREGFIQCRRKILAALRAEGEKENGNG